MIEFPGYDPAAHALALRPRLLESMTAEELRQYSEAKGGRRANSAGGQPNPRPPNDDS